MRSVTLLRRGTSAIVTLLLVTMFISVASAGPSGITVVSTFDITAARQERIEIAGLESETGRIALTLNLSPSFFGVTSSLRLETRDPNLLPPYIQTTEASDALGTYHFYEVWKATSFSTKSTYEAVLSLDTSTGLTSLAFGPMGGERFVERNLYLSNMESFEGVQATTPKSLDSTSSVLNLHDVKILNEATRLGKPVGIPERVTLRIAAAEDTEPFNWVVRQEVRTANVNDALRIAVRGIDTEIPGALEASVTEQGIRRVLWRGPVTRDVDVVLPGNTLEAGYHTVTLSYVDDSYTLDLADSAIDVKQASIAASAYVTDYVPGETVAGAEIHVFATNEVPDLSLSLTLGQTGRSVWSGSLSIPAEGYAVIPIQLAPAEMSQLAMAVMDGQAVEYTPTIPVYWSSDGLEEYVTSALASEPAFQVDPTGALTRAELVAALSRALDLTYHEAVRIAADTAVVRARHLDLSDVGPDAWYYEHLQAVQQAGLLSAALLDEDRFHGEEPATWGHAALLITRAHELVTGNLPKASASASPRRVEEYVEQAVADGWMSPEVTAEEALTWAELIEAFVRALEKTHAAQLLEVGQAALRYVLPGTEAYVPDQPYKSVGTFGMWSKGDDVRAKGWLGNEHHRGLLTFTWWPTGSTHELYWNAFNPDGSRLTLGQIGLAGDVRSRAYTVRDASTAQWDMTLRHGGRDQHTRIYLSRTFPAVLYVTESEEFSWYIDNHAFSLDYAAYIDSTGSLELLELIPGSGYELGGNQLGAPWILLYQELAATGELVPILIRMEHRPTSLTLRRDGGVDMRFSEAAGAIATMPLYGIARVGHDKLAQWHAGLPAEALELATFWSRATAAFPIGISEEYHADEAQGYVHVVSAFEYHEMQDDWGTEPLPLAPVPPVTALAEAHGYPVIWHSDIARSRTATFLGPYTYHEGTEVEYGLPIYASVDQVYTPVRVTGDSELEALQAQALSHVNDRWFRWPSPSVDSTLLASHAQTYSLVDDPDAKAWYKERIAQSLAEYYDERNLDTVFQPASGQSYVYNKRIWAAGEDFDREYYIGRQLVITSQVAHWVGWDVASPYWDAIRGLYSYYRIHWDWAWQGSTTFNTGFSFQADGVALAWEGMLGMVRMARMAGDDDLLEDALYRTAALGASMYALWELTDWAMENDHAVMSGGGTELPTRRRPIDEIITGFLPDTYSEFSGVVTMMATEWGASNWVHDELMGRTRFFNDYRFSEIYNWQIHSVPQLYPVLSDGYNISSHLHTRSILYGEDPKLREAIASVGIGTVQGAPGMSYHRVLLRSLVPQVWVSASTAHVTSNQWDAAAGRLTTEIEVVRDGLVVLDVAWRSIERIDPEAPAPDAGPQPGLVRVNGELAQVEQVQGGWWRVTVPGQVGERIQIEITYDSSFT